MSKVRLCTEFLSTGSRCRQFALKGQPWCYAHADPAQRLRNANARRLIATIPGMDLFDITVMLCDTVWELRRKSMPPLHAYALFKAAADRLLQLMEEASPTPPQTSAAPVNSNSGKHLYAVPIK